MPQHQDFGLPPLSRLEAVAQHAEEQEADCNHAAIMFRFAFDRESNGRDGVFGSDSHGDLTREGIKMLRLTAILLMTCALVPVYGRDKTTIDHAREDVEAAKKSPSVQPAPPAPPKRSDSTTVTIIRKMKRKEYSVPRSNQE